MHRELLDARSNYQKSVIPVRVQDDPDDAGGEGYMDFSPLVKKQLLLACLFALLIGNMMLLCVASFLPSFIEYNDWNNPDDKLSSFDTSLIIAVFSVA